MKISFAEWTIRNLVKIDNSKSCKNEQLRSYIYKTFGPTFGESAFPTMEEPDLYSDV